jgi:hypothetical protein
MKSTQVQRTPILDDTPEDRRVAVIHRLPNLSNCLATDVSAWAWHMTIVRDNELWRETDAVSWEDYCTRVVGKPLDWIEWIVGGYEALKEKHDQAFDERRRAYYAARLAALTQESE